MKNCTRLISFFLLVLLIQSCEKQDFDNGLNEVLTEDVIDSQFQSENFGERIKGNFVGLVRNKSGMKLEGVQITIGNSMTTTDRNGVFVMNDVDVFENFAYIKAQKAGYIDGSRMVIPKTEGANRIAIVLLDKEVTERINSGELSEVSLPSGAKVSFPGNFVTSDGNAYNGQVDVVMHYVYPNYTTTFTQMPGGLFAQTASNDAASLETYGMISVSLFSSSGQELNIDEESPATLEFPLGFNQSAVAPETIKLWYFDEEVGYWKEQGEATRVGDKYVGEVTHFSWWNCDIPFDAIDLCFSLSPENGDGDAPYYVLIRRSINNQLIFSGIVHSGEELECGLIPKNEEVEFFVYNVGITQACYGQLIHQEVIGGFSMNTTVDISFPQQQQLTTTIITGTATNCNGNPLTNGYLLINNNNFSSITNGIINVGVQHCDDENVIIQVYNADSGEWAYVDNITLTGGTLDIGTMSTCGNTGGIYNGNVALTSQEEVDEFGIFDYIVINGSLTIADGNTATSITDLTSLSNIETVTSTIQVTGNGSLESLEGLNNIRSVEDVRISGNALLTSLQGLDNINNLNLLTVRSNNALLNLGGMQSLTSINALSLRDNPALNSLSDLSNVTSINQFFLNNNDVITTLAGLEQITSMVYLWITNNDNLENLDGLENLVSISGGNFWPGLMIGWGPTDTPDHIPAANTSLTDFCALENLMTNGNISFDQVFIGNNAYNPSISDIANGNCSL